MTPQAEFGPDVSDDEEQEDRAPLPEDAWLELGSKFSERFKTMKRNSRIARGAALALDGGYMGGKTGWFVAAKVDGHRTVFYEKTLTDALIALAEAVDAA